MEEREMEKKKEEEIYRALLESEMAVMGLAFFNFSGQENSKMTRRIIAICFFTFA